MEKDITNKIKPIIRYTFPVILIVAVIFVAGIFVWHQRQTTITINDAKLTSSLVHVYAQVDGTLTEVLVNDGDKVEAGQVIAKVKVTVTPEQIQELQTAYNEAQANYDNLEQQVKNSVTTVTSTPSSETVSSGDIAGAQARLDAAAAEKQKMEKLYSIGAVSATQYAEAQSEYAAAQAALNAASTPVQVQSSVQSSTVSAPPSQELSEALAKAQVQLTQAKAALDQAQSDNNYAEITAPVSGIVYLTDFKQGDTLKQDDVFLNIGNTKNLWVEAPLTQAQYEQVRPGQFVRYSLDGMDLTGTVLELTHENDSNDSAQTAENDTNADNTASTDATNNNQKANNLITAAKISFPDDMIDQVVPGADVTVTITLDR